MTGNSGRHVIEPAWTGDEDKRLRALILGMWPYPKIFAEFPAHSPDTIRGACRRLFSSGEPTPIERAIFLLDGRGQITRSSPTGLRLDGRPASPVQLVAAANLILRADGLREIPYMGAVRA